MQEFLNVVNEVERYRDLSDEEKEQLVLSVLEHPYMDLRCDWAFKHILQNLEILKMLLNDFLPEEIDTVSLQPNEIDKMRPDDKNVIMDVLCQSVDGRKFIVEMQREKKRSFKNRMLYYGASMIHSQLKRKQPYSALKPVYVICFMDYKMAHESEQLVYRYSLREHESGEPYGDSFSIFLCELPRLKEKSLEGLDPIHSWFYILTNMRIFAGKPEDMGKRYAVIAEAAQMRNLPVKDKIQYFRNMITEEERQDIGGAYYEDGYKEGTRDTVLKFKEAGVSLEVISKATGLSPEEIASL